MDEKRIIPQGELAKFKIDIKDENYDISRDDFTLKLKYGMMKRYIEIPKSKCTVAAEGCYFSFDTTPMTGVVEVVCEYIVGDSDTGGERKCVNMQKLCFVTPVPCPTFICCPACICEDELIEYTRITESDATATYDLLCDKYGTVFVTRDLMNIYVLHERHEEAQAAIETLMNMQGNN